MPWSKAMASTVAAGAAGGWPADGFDAACTSASLARALHDHAVDDALDGVRERFGSAAITRAVLLGRDQGQTVPLLPD